MKRSRRWFAAVLLSGAMFSAGADGDLSIPLHHASYELDRGSLHIGDALFSLSHEADGSYLYQSVTHTAGLAALFRSDVVTESTRFQLQEGHLRPLQYSYTQRGGSEEEMQAIRFDWDKGEAITDEDGHSSSVVLGTGVYDRLLSQLLLSFDSLNGKPTPAYRVLDHGESSKYSVRNDGEASVHTPAGNFEAVKLELSDGKKGRVTDFWLVAKLHYLPARIEQKQPGKASISLVLTEITFEPSAKP